MKYYRITDGLNRVGKLIPETDNPYDHVNDLDKDWYLSIYKYTKEHKEHAEKRIKATKQVLNKETNKKETLEYERNQGVSDIEDVLTNKIVFDIDDEENLEKARDNTVTVVKRLKDAGIDGDNINVSFSGNKGFSIVIDHNESLTPDEHKSIAKYFAGDLNDNQDKRRKKFDTSVYNASRLFRLDFTKHSKSGLYKTPISLNQLQKCTIKTIKDFCKKKKIPQYKLKQVQLPESFKNLRPKEEPKKEENPEVVHRLDFSKKPYYLTDVKYALHKGFIPPSQGNDGMMILAATYKHVGFDKIDAYHMLKGVNEKRSEIYNIDMRSNDDIWEQVIDVVYNDAWKGGTFSPKENELLQQTAKDFGINEKSQIVDIKQLSNKFKKFAENINKNTIRTGIKSLDESVLMTTGMMIGVLGAPSSGKTSFGISIIEHLSKKGQIVCFESLDMYDNLLYQRLVQRVSGLNVDKKLRKKIEDDPQYDPSYNIEEDAELNMAMKLVETTYKNVEFNSSRGATIESIEEDIRVNKAKHGDNLKLVVIDYLEKVRGPYSDATASSGYIASRLSDLASTYDVAILLLLQPQKSAGDPSEELLSMRKIKGASIIEQDCRVILTLWRPGFNPKDNSNDHYSSVAIVKNNMGEVKQLDYSWNGLKGGLNELTHLEREQLERLREEIKDAKEAERKNGDF